MPPAAPPGEIVFTDDAEQLAPALGRVSAAVVGVDVERADADRYHRRAALIQIGDAEVCVLVDPLAIDDLTAVDAFLADRTVVLHAVENDLAPLEAVGIRPRHIADTAVAAAVLGLPTGLGPLLGEVLGVQLSGEKERYQRADWEARPLTVGMAAYAAGDVFHLPALWAALAERLTEQGRASWYEQELAATIERAGEDRRDWTRTKGAGRLSPEARAVLRALWEEREEIAREHDIAPNRLLREKVMLELAQEPVDSPAELVERSSRRGVLREYAERLFAAQQRGVEAPPEARESRGRRWEDAEKAAYDRMRRARSRKADELGIDAGVLCPGRPLLAAVAGEPSSAEELVELAQLRPWQRELLAELLWDTYRAALAEHATAPDTDDGERADDG